MRNDQNQIFCSQIYNKCLKNSALLWKSILAIIVTVVGLISFFFPNIALLFRQSLHWQTSVNCIWDFWHPHPHMFKLCNIHAQVQKLESSSLYLCCYDSQQSIHGVLGLVHQYRLFSPFSNWLLDNLLFLRADLIHLFSEANCIEFF